MTDSTATGPFSLDRLQRWMQTVITNTDGVPAGIDSAEARDQLPIAVEEVEKVITRSRNLSAIDRISVYYNAYYARLLQCLRGEFPVLLRAVSEEVFDAFAIDYLQRYPSRSYTLGQLGAQFAGYLAATRSEPDNSETGSSASWQDFVVDLAALEWTYSEVFDGPGVEGETLLDPAQLAEIGPDRLLTATLVPVPCLRLLEFRFPVQIFYSDVRKERDPSYPKPADTFLAVNRRDLVIENVELSALEFRMLTELYAGRSIGDAIAAIAANGDVEFDRLPVELNRWFQRWATEGFFRDLVLTASAGS